VGLLPLFVRLFDFCDGDGVVARAGKRITMKI
jgi:hypothetical protein